MEQYLRGECSRRELRDLAIKHQSSEDRTLRLIAWELVLFPGVRRITDTQEMDADWHYVRRALAILRGNLELDRVKYGRFGILHVLGAVAFGGVIGSAFAVKAHGWLPLLAAWAGSGLVALASVNRELHAWNAYQYAPFRSKEQWDAHEHLVTQGLRPAPSPGQLQIVSYQRDIWDQIGAVVIHVIFLALGPITLLPMLRKHLKSTGLVSQRSDGGPVGE